MLRCQRSGRREVNNKTWTRHSGENRKKTIIIAGICSFAHLQKAHDWKHAASAKRLKEMR